MCRKVQQNVSNSPYVYHPHIQGNEDELTQEVEMKLTLKTIK